MLERVPKALRVRIVFYEPTNCWIWCGAVNSNGYGHSYRMGTMHRHLYELMVGPIPDGLEIDHLCRVRQCCNPEHLEPVTRLENLRRAGILDRLRAFSIARGERTHCGRGHELVPPNSYVYRGSRTCRACQRTRYQQRQIAAGSA